VKGNTLDGFLGKAADLPNAMWIDVEGALGQVFAGADQTLHNCQAIHVKLDADARGHGELIDVEVVSLLDDYGLKPVLRDIQKKGFYNTIFVQSFRVNQLINLWHDNSEALASKRGARTPMAVAIPFEAPHWARSLYGYKKYGQAKNVRRLRNVFEELVFNDHFWTCEQDQNSPLHQFEQAVRAHSGEGIGQQIIEREDDSLKRGTVRLVLAARAALVHNNIALADCLINTHRDTSNDSHYEARLERLLLTMRCPEAALSNLYLFESLAPDPRTNTKLLAEKWIDQRWLYEGPSSDLLQVIVGAVETLRHSGVRHLEPALERTLALAFRLKDMSSVDRLLTDFPELIESYDRVLPLAAYLISDGTSANFTAERARVVDYAELYKQLNLGIGRLTDAVADKTRTVAIVGNSPSELSLNQGQIIDDHDIVVRFNRFITSDQFAPDYGKKTTIHVRRSTSLHDQATCSSSCCFAVIRHADVQYRLRRTSTILDLRHTVSLCALPLGFETPLYRALRTPPSAGLVFSSFVHSMRGTLARESCFGLSFRAAPTGESWHYFKESPTRYKHYWAKERTIFESLLA
jgi:hypothetical protein